MKKLLRVLFFVIINIYSFAQNLKVPITNTIVFTVDISELINLGIGGAFDPSQDSLLVMGLDWEGGTNVIGNRKIENTDPSNPWIYTTTLSVQSAGDSTRWEFKAYPDSRFQNEGWEFGPDRWYVYRPNDSLIILPTIIPRIRPLFPILQTDVDLKIYVDMSYAHNRYNGMPIPLDKLEFVGIGGSEDFLGSYWGGCWCPDDTTTGLMKVLTRFDSGNFWLYHTVLPAGMSTGRFEYKFAAMYTGADTMNGGNSPLDNELPFDAYHLLALTGSTTNLDLFVYFGNFEPHNAERLEDFVPFGFQLEQNYPNPFNPTTVIRYSIPEIGFVTLKVFNLLGQEVESLVNNEQTSGVYEATLDASELSSGVYFYTLKTKNFTTTKKMILLR